MENVCYDFTGLRLKYVCPMVWKPGPTCAGRPLPRVSHTSLAWDRTWLSLFRFVYVTAPSFCTGLRFSYSHLLLVYFVFFLSCSSSSFAFFNPVVVYSSSSSPPPQLRYHPLPPSYAKSISYCMYTLSSTHYLASLQVSLFFFLSHHFIVFFSPSSTSLDTFSHDVCIGTYGALHSILYLFRAFFFCFFFLFACPGAYLLSTGSLVPWL